MLDDQDLAALALTSRLVESAAKPLSAREFWAMRRDVEPSALLGMTAHRMRDQLAGTGLDAERVTRLLDRNAALAITIEKLGHSGIWTITGVGPGYPTRLRGRLRDAAPVVLHGVGDPALLDSDGIGVVGSREVSEAGSRFAREIAKRAAKAGLPLVSGAARGVDSEAMNGAFEAGGHVVGVLADALERAVTRRSTRRGVVSGQICLVTPFTPSTPFSVGNAMGRNKIIYGLSRCTVVVSSDRETGGTWAGATEALKHQYGRVASWVGEGCGAGNAKLVEQGAVELADLGSFTALFEDADAPPAIPAERANDQLRLGF
ncbi:MAG: DNA-processing protein DprA [Mycobacterium sp.]